MGIFQVHILSPLFGLLTNAISQLLGCRYAKKLGLLQSVFIGFLLGFGVVLTIEAGYCFSAKPALVECLSEIVLSSMTYAAFGYCYFHFINLGETARRVRIMRELSESREGLTMTELLERYNAADIVSVRLRRLLRNQQIVCRNASYYVNGRTVLWMARAIVSMKLILLGKRAEFE